MSRELKKEKNKELENLVLKSLKEELKDKDYQSYIKLRGKK